MNAALDSLATIPGVWRGLGQTRANAEPTGNAELDAALAGGWPVGALSQIVGADTGLGFALILPLLARLTAAGRAAALVAPPYIPYAPALREAGVRLEQLLWVAPKDRVDGLWATEQMLRSGLFGAVALWSPSLDASVERRLQLAAETGRSVGIASHLHSCPANAIAAVRLQVSAVASPPAPAAAPAVPAAASLAIEVLRCRGARSGTRVSYPLQRRAA